MTTLKNSDREEALRRILETNFSARFAAINARLQELLREHLKKEHPHFIKLVSDANFRRYTTTQNVRNFYFKIDGENVRAAIPCYGKWAEMPAPRVYLDREKHTLMQDNDTAVPYFMSEYYADDAKLIKEYRATWADYTAAYEKLSALLWGYGTREKFTTDFPEFAKFLPPVVVKAKLPAVIVKDVRKDLRRLGIPQK